MKKNSTIAIPDNWEDLTAEQKYEVARALLIGAATDTGILDEAESKTSPTSRERRKNHAD
ncbi:MAG TPA: hypothetical protein VIS05_02755 [Ilumatobacter sp.]